MSVGHIRKKPENIGNNFVAVGRIRKNRKKAEKPEKTGNDRIMKRNNYVAAGPIRNKLEKVGKIPKNPEMRGTGRGTILLRSDASGKTSEKQESLEKYENERNMKGNNFVAVDADASGKSRKTPEMRGTGRGTILWQSIASGKRRKNPAMTGT